MKENALSLLLAGTILMFTPTQAGCDQGSTELSFTQGESQYVIDPWSGGVSIFSRGGLLLETYHSTAAGPEQEENPHPSPIIHYLLPGKGSISGLVWNDLNGSGRPDAVEYGVRGVLIYIDSDQSATYTAGDPSALTDDNGMYLFPRIKKGAKTVHIDLSTLPSGYEPTTVPYPFRVNLAANQKAYDADFGVQELSGKITGTIKDQTEGVPISSVTVYLERDSDGAVDDNPRSGNTDASGNYQFSKVPGGDYYIYVDTATLDDKYLRTPVEGTIPAEVTFPPGGSLTVDFAYAHQAIISGAVRDDDGNTMGYVTLFIDLNGNGEYDAGEPITMSDQNGSYIFDQLFPGAYTVLILDDRLPAGYEVLVSPGTITVDYGDNYNTADCSTQGLPVAISGSVWNDENGNGVRETAENGLADVTVFLDADNNGIPEDGEPTTATDATGAYAFTGLKHGEFYIRPDDSTLSSYISTTEPNPVYLAIAPGQSYEEAKFGYQRKLALVHTLQYPTRLAWGADSKLYVSDHSNNSVFIHDSGLNVLGELKGLAQPLGVIADGDGNIYVGNQGRKNVEVYDAQGNLLRAIGDGDIGKPNDLALDRGNNIYVLDSSKNTVLVYDREGTLTSAIGDALLIKYGVAIAISYRDDGIGTEIGELYVADQRSCAIHVFALDGTYRKSIGGRGSLYTSNWDSLFAGLMAVAIDPYGNIHGLDNNLNVVQVFEPQNGTFLRSYNAYSPENEHLLNLQTDIAIHPADFRVVMSNVATRSVETIATVPAP